MSKKRKGVKTPGFNDHDRVNIINIETVMIIESRELSRSSTDILNTGWVSLFLISDRMKSILKENQLSGWKSYPIKLYDKKGAEIPGYSRFSITGTCKSIDYSKSEIIEKSAIPGGPVSAYYKGSHVDDWNGTDFFAPVDSYQIIITGKAAEILKENKITNMKLIDLVDFEIPVRYITGTDTSTPSQKR